jgi:serine/threonine protein kinase
MPGESLVRQRLYHILKADGLAVTQQNWVETVNPRTSLVVSMALFISFFPVSRDIPMCLSFAQQARLLEYSVRYPTTTCPTERSPKSDKMLLLMFTEQGWYVAEGTIHLFSRAVLHSSLSNKFVSLSGCNMVMDEIAIMSQCNRPNIVDFYDVIWQVGDDYIWIVMEYADCGSLTDLIYFSHDLREDHIALLCCEVGSF